MNRDSQTADAHSSRGAQGDSPLSVPESVPRQVHWFGRLPRDHGLRSWAVPLGVFLLVAAALAIAATTSSLVTLFVLPLALLVLALPPGSGGGPQQKSLDRVMRHGTRAQAEILSVDQVGPPSNRQHRVRFRYWDVDGSPHLNTQMCHTPSRPPVPGPTTALLDPWNEGLAVLPALFPITFGEPANFDSIPAAPRTVAQLQPLPPYRPGGRFLLVLAGMLGLVALTYAVAPAVLALAVLLAVITATLVPMALMQRVELERRVTDVARWGQPRQFQVLELKPPGTTGTRRALVRFLDGDAEESTLVQLAVDDDWSPPSGSPLLGLVEPGFQSGRSGDCPIVVMASEPHVSFQKDAPAERPRQVLASLDAPVDAATLPLHTRAYPLAGAREPGGGELRLAGHELCWARSGEDVSRIDGNAPFHLDVTCWELGAQLEVGVTLRQGSGRVSVRTTLAPEGVRVDVARKQSRAPWLLADDFRTFWAWAQFYAEAHGQDTALLDLQAQSKPRTVAVQSSS